MKTTITLKRLGAVLAFLFGLFSISSAAGVQTINEPFSAIGFWTTNTTNASISVTGGHLNCTMALSGTKYRGDLYYNFSGTAANNIILNPANDVYLAIKFIGNRQNGNL